MMQTLSVARGVVVLAALAGMACDDNAAPRTPLSPTLPPQSAPAPVTGPTRQVTGIVVDTDDRPVNGAQLTQTWASTVSGPDGRFAFAAPVAGPHSVTIAASGFEPRLWGWGAGDGPLDLRLPIARRVVFTPGQPLTASLTTNDLPYYVGEPYDSDYCRPCKLIRVDGETGAAFTRVHLRWTGDVALDMWASEGTSGLTADVGPRHLSVLTVGSGDARRLYVGVKLGNVLARPIPFSLTVE